jgi:hypothetical protein
MFINRLSAATSGVNARSLATNHLVPFTRRAGIFRLRGPVIAKRRGASVGRDPSALDRLRHHVIPLIARRG